MISILFVLQCSLLFVTYITLHKRRTLFDDRFGKTYTLATSGVGGFIIAMTLVFIVPELGVWMTIGAVLAGGIIGFIFGSLYKLQTVLAGIGNGSIGAIMGAMLGLVVLDPALCGLPGVAARDISTNVILFSTFGTVSLFVTMWLVIFSLKV